LNLTRANIEPTRYALSGAICAVVNNLVLIGADRLGLGYAGVLAASWGISGSLGYALHTRFTFFAAPSWMAYARFMAGVALGIPLAFVAIWCFRSGLNWPMWASAPSATIVMVAFNYFSARVAILGRNQRLSGVTAWIRMPRASRIDQ
jgi:putative flippase GtrA